MFKRSSALLSAWVEGLETRQLLSHAAPFGKFSLNAFYFNDIETSASGGAGGSPFQTLSIRNAGTAPLLINKKGVQILGADADQFRFVGMFSHVFIQPGEIRTMPIQFTAKSTGIKTATLRILNNDHHHTTVDITLRGLGTAGEGGDLEPSLQTVLDLFQVPINVGDSNPSSTTFSVPPSTPNDEVNLQQMVKAGPGKVQIDLLAEFSNSVTPASFVGWYHPGQPELGKHKQITILGTENAQRVMPTTVGKISFDPGDNAPFGLYTVYPAFHYRESYSEDQLNTWEPKSQNRRKIRFYPLKKPDGTLVPNAYIFAAEDYNVTYDFQDNVGIIRNVKLAPATPTLGLQNADGLPNNNQMVFNRMTNLDLLRPNKFDDTATLDVINSGAAPLGISSIKLSDNTNFKIISGGGSNIQLNPDSSRNVTIQFVANPTTNSVTVTYNATLTVTSTDPEEPVRTINLAGLWQNGSEKTPNNKYSEASLATIVKLFGYTTVITNPGETTNHGGHPVLVGDEVNSPYWDQADPAQSITVSQLAAFHRQNNFDAITGLPITAASTIAWYNKGQSSTIHKIFTGNIDEGQSLLPHISGSTTKPAMGTFRQSGSTPFGFVVDKNHFTDDSLNALDFNPNDPNMTGIPGTGHSFRIYPLKDANGNLIKNTYIFAQDYTSNPFANWDYNDNVFLISNVKPANLSASPMALAKANSASLFAQAQSAPADSSDLLGAVPKDLL